MSKSLVNQSNRSGDTAFGPMTLRSAEESLTPRSMEILRMLLGSGKRNTVFSCWTSQTDLARKLELTRQALSIHFKRLRESGFIQVGHGFVNVTEDGLRAIDHGANPVIVAVRFSPQKRMQAFAAITALPIIETHRVTGGADAVLIVNQNRLDYVLSRLTEVDSLVDAKSFVSIGKIEAFPKSPESKTSATVRVGASGECRRQ